MTTTILQAKPAEKKLYPHFETNPDGFFNKIVKIDHPFLQALADSGAVIILMQGEFTVMGYSSLALLFVYEDRIELECISTPVDERGKGSATKLMQGFCQLADETQTTITLRTANVTGNGWSGLPQHLVVNHGMQKKGKLPPAQLPKWYEKFGFEKVERYNRKGKWAGWKMIRKPQPVQA